MGAMSSQITSLTIVYSTVYSGADQSKHQSSASLAFVWGIHQEPVNSPHKWPVMRKILHLMTSSWRRCVREYQSSEYIFDSWMIQHETQWSMLNIITSPLTPFTHYELAENLNGFDVIHTLVKWLTTLIYNTVYLDYAILDKLILKSMLDDRFF